MVQVHGRVGRHKTRLDPSLSMCEPKLCPTSRRSAACKQITSKRTTDERETCEQGDATDGLKPYLLHRVNMDIVSFPCHSKPLDVDRSHSPGNIYSLLSIDRLILFLKVVVRKCFRYASYHRTMSAGLMEIDSPGTSQTMPLQTPQNLDDATANPLRLLYSLAVYTACHTGCAMRR